MTPHLHIKLFRFRIYSFHFFGVLGFIAGSLLGTVLAKPAGLHPEIVLLLSAAGAGTFFLLAFAAKWITKEETIVYYHHEVAILLVCSFLLYFLRLPVLPYLDLTLLGIGTFLAFGRIGCFSVGCCHGRPHKHGVTYGDEHVDAGFTWYYKDVPLLPVQLIESGYVFLILIVGTMLVYNLVQPGTIVIVYTVVYGLFRFLMEYYRGDPDRPSLYGLTEAQVTTLALTGITFFMGKFNLLPEYNWHGVILLAMFAACVLTLLFYRKHPEYLLVAPKQLPELAEGLNVLEEVNNTTIKRNANALHVFTTKNGLSLSCGYFPNGIKHYTVSTQNNTLLNTVTAKKIAEQIQLLNHHGQYKLISKPNNVVHILFSEAPESSSS